MNRTVCPLDPDQEPAVLCPELLPVSEAYRNPWFKVMDRGSYYVVEYDRPQVVVLPIVDDSHFVLVRVRRPVVDDTPLELPAGDSAEDETPIEAARREFHEETGIWVEDLNRFEPILPISEQPGRSPVLLSVFKVRLAMSEFEGRDQADEEIQEVCLIPYRDAERMIVEGSIYVSSPMAIISRYMLSINHD